MCLLKNWGNKKQDWGKKNICFLLPPEAPNTRGKKNITVVLILEGLQEFLLFSVTSHLYHNFYEDNEDHILKTISATAK